MNRLNGAFTGTSVLVLLVTILVHGENSAPGRQLHQTSYAHPGTDSAYALSGRVDFRFEGNYPSVQDTPVPIAGAFRHRSVSVRG
jgi:hypothetical protein